MAFNYSPKAVTNGLIFCLDSANLNSYPRSGTVWRDLTPSQRNTTLTNGPTFNVNNGGSIVFDGINDSGDVLGNTFDFAPGTTGNLSLELYIYPTGPYTAYVAEPPTTNLGGFFGQGYVGNFVGWGIGMATISSINYWLFQVRNSGTVVTTPTVAFTNNSWYHVVGTFTRNDLSRLYVNGTLQSSASSTSLNNISITPNTNNAKLGLGNIFYAGCRIATARIYNRALSAAEVLQNYNALKGRFQ
jgi:hypothetical protein